VKPVSGQSFTSVIPSVSLTTVGATT